jgi:hypothetical protein
MPFEWVIERWDYYDNYIPVYEEFFRKWISDPLLDRIGIHIEVPRVTSKQTKIRIANYRISFATPTCAWGRWAVLQVT